VRSPLERAASRKWKQETGLRFRMRETAQRLTRRKGFGRCGRVPVVTSFGAEVTIRVDRRSGIPYFHGLARCNSPWECPICLPRIQRGRAQELQTLNAEHLKRGGAVYMATLTIPHDVTDRLKPMREHVARAWTFCTTGAPWRRQADRLGLVGHVRALEVTTGGAGWHAHCHVALYTSGRVRPRNLLVFRGWLRDRWTRAVVRAGYRPPSERHGVRVTELSAGNYLAKMGLEVVSLATKHARHGNRTPFELLRDLTLGVDVERRLRDRRLWREWGDGMLGARQLTYSRALKQLADRYRVEVERGSEALDGQLELERLDDARHRQVYVFGYGEWAAIRAAPDSWRLRLYLLEAATRAPPDAADLIAKIIDRARGLPAVPF
jgi:Replication protein